MFCEIAGEYGFLALWMSMNVLGLVSMMTLSTLVFIPLYGKPSFETWKLKCNPNFPSPALVRKEIIHTVKGLVVATLIPAFTLVASFSGWSQGYCGDPHNIGIKGFLIQTAIIFAFTDFVEYGYHWCGHYYQSFWQIHKHHHAFYNPTPFAVIADDWPDQFCRTLPMIILPCMMPINMDLLFFIFASLFYGYGVYLHSGYESIYLSTHNPVFNTSYHHYYHHAKSAIGLPIYTGFFFKIWDQLFNTEAKKGCVCHECRPKKERSKKIYNQISKPDYSVMMKLDWWLSTSLDVKE
jgi:Delta7-sterol 5-desaturase